jgi:hypothetical protein
MNTAEIVIREVQGDSSLQVRQLLAESICQPRQAAKLHSHREVLPFNVAGRDMRRVGVALSNFGYNLRDWAWGVPLIPVLAIISEQLHELGKIHVSAERFSDSFPVVRKSIGSELQPMTANAAVEVVHERVGIVDRSFADDERGNEFGIRIKGNVNPLIAKVGGVILANMSRLLRNEGPNFVALNTTTGQLTHSLIQDFRATLPSAHEQPHDSVAIEASHTFCRANRTALKKALDSPRRRIGIRGHRFSCQSCVGFAESGIARIAAPTLNPALTEVPESFAGLVLASEAGHVISPLALCGETSQNTFGSRAWVTPRFGLAPTSVSAEAGAYYSATSFYGGLTVIGGLLSCRPVSAGRFAFAAKSLIKSALKSRLKSTSVAGSLQTLSTVARVLFRQTNMAIVGASVLYGGLNPSCLHETLQDGVNRSHRIGMEKQMVFDSLSDLHRSHGLFFGFQNLLDGAGQAKGRSNIEKFIHVGYLFCFAVEQVNHSADDLLQARDSFGDIKLLGDQRGQFFEVCVYRGFVRISHEENL